MGSEFAKFALHDSEGLCFSQLCCRYAYGQLSTGSSLALLGTFGFSIYSIWNKRKKRRPEGPYLGKNPVFGAVLITIAAFAVQFAVCQLTLYVELNTLIASQCFVPHCHFALFNDAARRCNAMVAFACAVAFKNTVAMTTAAVSVLSTIMQRASASRINSEIFKNDPALWVAKLSSRHSA